MNESPRRICPFCAESIPACARLCPRCRQWLSWRSLRHPMIQLLLIQVPLLVLVLLGFGQFLRIFQRLLDPQPHYTEASGALAVIRSTLNWVDTEKGPRLFVTGVLTNHSALAWRDPEFECRFFDADGNLVDAAHRTSFMTVKPADDPAFRVVIEPARPRDAYHALQVRVSWAKNARAFF
jgi:predicted nucleic acid-binding Zn ribbon protein